MTQLDAGTLYLEARDQSARTGCTTDQSLQLLAIAELRRIANALEAANQPLSALAEVPPSKETLDAINQRPSTVRAKR